MVKGQTKYMPMYVSVTLMDPYSRDKKLVVFALCTKMAYCNIKLIWEFKIGPALHRVRTFKTEVDEEIVSCIKRNVTYARERNYHHYYH